MLHLIECTNILCIEPKQRFSVSTTELFKLASVIVCKSLQIKQKVKVILFGNTNVYILEHGTGTGAAGRRKGGRKEVRKFVQRLTATLVITVYVQLAGILESNSIARNS